MKPFQWGYHFDKIIQGKDGFDVIIANQPWEVFKLNAKDFFIEDSNFISKKKMDIKAFEKAHKDLLQESKIAAAKISELFSLCESIPVNGTVQKSDFCGEWQKARNGY